VDVIWFDFHFLFCRMLKMFFDDFGGDADDMLSLPIFNEIEGLEGGDDIFCFDGCHLADIFDGQISSVLTKDFKENLSPIASIRQQTEIRERLFRGSHLSFFLGEFIRERNEQFSVSLSLIRR